MTENKVTIQPKFAVLGAGHGGTAMAGHLSLAGFDTSLYNRGADRIRVAHAVRLLGSMPGVSVIIVNLLGGITRCDEVAAGIIEAGVSQQVIVRLAGTNEEEGRQMLNQHGYRMLDTMEEAVGAAVEVAS